MNVDNNVVSLSVKEQGAGGWSGTLNVSLNITAAEFKKKLLQPHTKLDPNCMKILSSGKFLKPELTLSQQGIKATSKILVLKQAPEESVQKMLQEEDNIKKLNATLQVAEELASRTDGGDTKYEQYYFELENQKGEKIQLPEKDRKAIIIGMTLHDKARKLLKKEEYKLALELLLQANTSFSKCSEEFINAIDNWALLHLDICWAYFKIKDLVYLKDASWRLNKAKELLEKSYGRDLERLTTLKGPTTLEHVVFIRLQLIEAILQYHANQHYIAKALLNQLEQKVKSYLIEDSELVNLISMGFSTKESKAALKACKRNQEQAVLYVLKKREERKLKQEADEKLKQEKKEARKYGKNS